MRPLLNNKTKTYIRYIAYAFIAIVSFLSAKNTFQVDRMLGILLALSTIISILLFFSDWYNNIKNARQIQENKKNIEENKGAIQKHEQQIEAHSDLIEEQSGMLHDLATQAQEQKDDIKELYSHSYDFTVQDSTLKIEPISKDKSQKE